MKNILYIGNKLAKHGKPPTGIDTLSVKLEEEGYSVSTASAKQNKFLRLMDMLLTTLKKKNEISVVLIDTYSTQNFYYAVIIGALCRFFGIPYVPILHGGNLPKRLEENKSLSQKLFNNAFTNVVPSTYLMEKFEAYGYKNLTYIPNTLEIENYPFTLRKNIKAKLLWVRSFSGIYNPLLALQIVELLKEDGVEVSLCMVGPEKDGAQERCKKVAKELNLPIKFTGMLAKKEWIALSKEYDLFINTTNFDNMPVSVMEAMALGLPVISTNVGGLPYLIENDVNGILLPPNNPAAFAEKIKDLLSDPLKVERLSTNARQEVENFDWQQIKLRWIELFEKFPKKSI